ncbi:hypothetical protein FS837_008824 [Tulasnella sp. UAMH 9824]|nr:hypothetical protein FS837_008824 [Tulasnella sp. UAMH 9824]
MITLVTQQAFVTMEAPDGSRIIGHGRQTRARDPMRYADVPKREDSPGPHCHIDKLPEEVLLMIFSFVLLGNPYTIPKSQRTALLLVCKLWTRVVTESHFFWTAIDWSSTELEQEWDHSLGLSKGFPFAIACGRGDNSHPRNAHNVKDLLNWAIIKSVRIGKFRFMHRKGVEPWALVWQALTQSSRSLEEIELFSGTGISWYIPKQDATFLGAHAPRLQSLTLHSVVVPWTLCAVPTLRKLSISFYYQLSLTRSDFLPKPVDILSIITSTPALETLHLAGMDKHRAQDSTALPIVSPQQLKELNVEGLSNGSLRCLAESLDIPPMARVNFTLIETRWPDLDSDPTTEFGELVSLLSGYGLLHDSHLELEETALRITNLHGGIQLASGYDIDYNKAFRPLSEQARSRVLSASISSVYCEGSREPLEAIHDTFPGVALFRFPVHKFGNGFGDWPKVLENPGRAARGNLPESLCPKLTEIEVDLEVMLGFDLSELLSFIRARNSPNRHEGDEGYPRPISRLQIRAPSRIPFLQRSIWKEIKAMVTSCKFKVTSWKDPEGETSSSGNEDY